jgi:isoquinoline 1-oxidoreductase beta subunit
MRTDLGFPISIASVETSRRGFIVGATAMAGGLLVGLRPLGVLAATDPGQEAANPLTGYVLITPDNKVTVLSSQFDMGQGSYHGIATLVVEELGADWSQIDVRGAAGNPKLYGNLAWGGAFQGTGGSSSMRSSFDRYRLAGAVARTMLVNAAAEEWSVAAGEILIAGGVLSHPSGKSATFGEVAAKAAGMPVPREVPLKERSAWKHIGDAALRRYDSPAKADGTHMFTTDVKLPKMLTAVVSHPPRFGGKVRTVDASEALQVRGVTDVVEIPRGVAVVAEHMWAAIKGREALRIAWDDTNAETRGSSEILADYRSEVGNAPTAIARAEGDAAAALAKAAKTIEATYEFPYLAHAPMEPLNSVCRMNADGTLEVWGGHQMPDLYRAICAKVAGIPAENITMHVMKTGGGFGRRGVPDADIVSESVMVAKAIGFRAPVKVQWTREDDMTGGRYRPAYVHSLKAGIDDDGRLVAWDHHIVGQSILKGTPFESAMIVKGVDQTSVEGAANVPYEIPNLSVGLTTSDVRVPVLWWRAVGSTHTAYAVETFIDEIAETIGKDPFELRMELLKDHPRHARVLMLAAEKAGWSSPPPEGRHRGIALHESFHSVVADVVEVSIEGGEPRVHKVVVAVDCGTVINPDVVRAQMEGGTGFGLGSVLAEELTLKGGVVDQTNYDGYTPLRIDSMPEVEVHIVESDERPTGVGEPGVPTIGPAVANAVAAATGRRIRSLPLNQTLAS